MIKLVLLTYTPYFTFENEILYGSFIGYLLSGWGILNREHKYQPEISLAKEIAMVEGKGHPKAIT
jgi:hypothetical protein